METITEIAVLGIKTIPSCDLELSRANELEKALLAVVDTPDHRQATLNAEQAFWRLSQQEAGSDSLNSFLNGWKTVHITGLYVAGLMIRVEREAHAARAAGDDVKASLLSEAAYHIGEIIPEDTGLDGPQHGVLFERLATAVAGDDTWKLDENAIPECDAFRRFVELGRTKGPVEDAILITAASENWNTGEYTYASPITNEWLGRAHQMDETRAKATNAYVSVHAGDTELDHFTHALKAWQLYNEANGTEARPEKAAEVFSDYAERASVAYAALRDSLPKPQPILRLNIAADFKPQAAGA